MPCSQNAFNNMPLTRIHPHLVLYDTMAEVAEFMQFTGISIAARALRNRVRLTPHTHVLCAGCTDEQARISAS
jgi:hypothetical protein